MNNQDISTLRGHGTMIDNFTYEEIDGNGQNLYDVKYSFDYVKKTLEKYNISGIQFSQNLIDKVDLADSLLLDIINSLKYLTKDIYTYCDKQEEINKG